MTTLYLVRHAKAGDRRRWDGDDALRPLSKAGRRQAEAIGDALAGCAITRVLSSPFTRCQQTVEPLARRLGITIEAADALAEGARLDDTMRLLDKVLHDSAVLCSHGDVFGNLLEHLAARGVDLAGNRLEKGSTWELDVDDGEIRRARHYAPPA